MAIVRHFFLAYFYDMTQYDPNLIINDYGLPMWQPFGLPGPATPDTCITFNWWIRDKCEHYIILADGNPAGFVIILADKSQLAPDVAYELMDFYIAPKYRRQKIGQAAALATFGLHQGNWQVFQLELNLPARAFWQAIIKEYTDDNYQNLDNDTQQRFTN